MTVKNTQLLSSIGELSETKMNIEKSLNDALAPEGFSGESEKDREERERIMTYIKLQAREIEALRAEISMLKRKDSPTVAVPSLPVPRGGNNNDNDGFLPPIPRVSSR